MSNKTDIRANGQTKTGNIEAQEASEKKNGRPELDDNEKEDSTITKEASL